MQKAINSKERNKKIHFLGDILDSDCNESKKTFEILFLRDDADQSVEVVESSIINFSEVIEQLRLGNSVFIAPKKQSNSQLIRRRRSKGEDNSYITHV